MDIRIERLRAVRRFETEAQMQEFDELLESLGSEESSDPELLSELLCTFIDDTEEEEHMWGLLHFVEGYPHEIYLPTLIGTLPRMRPHARRWGTRLLLRVLNDSGARAHVRELYHKLTESEQQHLGQFLNDVAQKSTELASKVAEVTAT